jgi:hypothetical protein
MHPVPWVEVHEDHHKGVVHVSISTNTLRKFISKSGSIRKKIQVGKVKSGQPAARTHLLQRSIHSQYNANDNQVYLFLVHDHKQELAVRCALQQESPAQAQRWVLQFV